jgi:hypothetical protein
MGNKKVRHHFGGKDMGPTLEELDMVGFTGDPDALNVIRAVGAEKGHANSAMRNMTLSAVVERSLLIIE